MRNIYKRYLDETFNDLGQVETFQVHYPEDFNTGVPDPLRGKAVKATVVLASGFKPSDVLTRELQQWVKNKTAPYKYPRIVDYVDELPKTVNGKIRRVAIRQADEAGNLLER